jgi:hypothetical protein
LISEYFGTPEAKNLLKEYRNSICEKLSLDDWPKAVWLFTSLPNYVEPTLFFSVLRHVKYVLENNMPYFEQCPTNFHIDKLCQVFIGISRVLKFVHQAVLVTNIVDYKKVGKQNFSTLVKSLQLY